MPTGKWKSDEDVTNAFVDMLERSIPAYEQMRDLTASLAKEYRRPGRYVVDLGCSRGDALLSIAEGAPPDVRLFGCDVSEPMLQAARERLAGHLSTVVALDLRERFPDLPASCILSVLTLQFIPIEYRLRVVSDAYKHLDPGGAFFLVEKVLGASADLDQAFVDRYYDLKRANGYTEDQIQRKRLSLEGVLVPVTARWNEEMLHGAGFRQVDCYWRWANFAGWIAVK